MKINANGLGYKQLNEKIKEASGNVTVEGVLGERFIASGLGKRKITIKGTPGNALGAYMDGATVEVYGNAQDATGDTMNDGKIVVHGSVGDALGYAMRGGRIYVRGDAGYRAGVHIKEYNDKKPVIIVGGVCGSFLGEYMAGGRVVVLNLANAKEIVGNFTGVGMHGGKIYLRMKENNVILPSQVTLRKATKEDMAEISGYLHEYADDFDLDGNYLLNSEYYVLSPDSANPYKRLYTSN